MDEAKGLFSIREGIGSARDVLDSMADDVGVHAVILQWSQVFARSLDRGGTLFFAGNGGSFADALHLAAEFTGKMGRRRPPLAACALGSNGSSMSAIGNDYAFDEVFARELRGLSSPASALLVMSTSGSSKNILRLVETAKEIDIPVLAFTGGSGGALSSMCDCVHVPSNRTERIQEAHMVLGHVLCGLIESQLSGSYFEWD